jgi:hypothetical protein
MHGIAVEPACADARAPLPPVSKSRACKCVAAIVRAEARPGQMLLRPPVKPAK